MYGTVAWVVFFFYSILCSIKNNDFKFFKFLVYGRLLVIFVV
jgi:hypothetical protein